MNAKQDKGTIMMKERGTMMSVIVGKKVKALMVFP